MSRTFGHKNCRSEHYKQDKCRGWRREKDKVSHHVHRREMKEFIQNQEFVHGAAIPSLEKSPSYQQRSR